MLVPLSRVAVTLVICSIVPFMLVACGGDGDDDTAAQPSPTTAASTPTPPLPATIPMDDLPEPVKQAIQAAASDAGVSVDDVAVTNVSEEQWSDTALGCPEPGGVYAQVITDGYSVQFIIDGTEYEYHTDMGSNIVRCKP